MTRTRVLGALALTTGLAFAIALSSCAFTSDLSGSISGTVRSTETSQPISDATIECAGQLTFSASDGSYSIEGISPGDRAVYASAAGYNDFSEIVDVGEATLFDINMTVYVPPARLFGYVTHATFGAIEGATVQVGGLFVVTDSQGYYEFPNVLQTTYSMTVSKDGYRQFSGNVRPDESDYQFDVALKYLATATFEPVADATIYSGAPEANAGSFELLQLYAVVGLKESFLITFAVDGLEPTAEPVSAKLRLYHTEEEGIEATRAVMVALVLEPWQEAHVTYSNAPGTSGPSNVSSQYEDNWLEADVTPFLSSWIVGGTENNGLLVDTPNDSQSGRFNFASREWLDESVRPEIVLEYAW